MATDLYNIENSLYLGNYAQVVSEGASLKLSDPKDKERRDSLILRAYIGMGQFDLVLSEVKQNSSSVLQSIRVLATYLSDASSREKCIETIHSWMNDGMTDATTISVATLLFLHEADLDQALKCLNSCPALDASLELQYLLVTIYLRMNRLDLAAKQLKVMQTLDDDATITQLAAAYMNLALGGRSIAEAESTFQDLSDKYGETVGILNGLALCAMATRKFDDAEKRLVKALGKRSNDAETLINLIVCAQHLRKPADYIARYISQLRVASPTHPWIARLNDAEASFSALSERFRPTTVTSS